MTAPFPSGITSIEELRGLVQPPSEMVCGKVIQRLDEHCRTLIAHAPFAALATSGDRDVSQAAGTRPGSCSCSTSAGSSFSTDRATGGATTCRSIAKQIAPVPALTCRAARGYVFECAPSENRAAHRGEPAGDRARGRVPIRRTT